MEVNKAKMLFDLVRSETTAKGVFLNGVGQAPSPSGKPPNQHIFDIFRRTIPNTTPHDGSLWDRDHITDEKYDLERVYRSSRESLWSSPAPTQTDQQLSALHKYLSEVIKDQDTSFPIPDIDIIYQVISRTKNSSLGQDGIPYSAWRLIGYTIAVFINKFFLETH
eukprot:14709667-Heterocapsa_arctica.AAC.1